MIKFKALNLQKDLIDTETEIFIRDRENLDDFLYELDSSYIKKEAAKSFDHLDMIFIIGDPFLLPWAQQARKVFIKFDLHQLMSVRLYD